MIEFTATHFDHLCAAPRVRERMGAIEQERRAAVRTFWKRALIGLTLGAAAYFSLDSAGWPTAGFLLLFVFLIGGLCFGGAALSAVQESLKHPVLEALAEQAGLEFMPGEFDPPAFGAACNLLFGGGGFSSRIFSDLFHGVDEDGRGHAVYEACLQRRAGKNSYTVFSGQIYAFQRRPGSEGHTVIVPDRKILNFFKPARDMDRVGVEGDAEFERRFEAYCTHPHEARLLLSDPAFRARLLELRKNGRVFVYAGPDEAVVAASGKDRFEPGSMFRARPGPERVRLMFDDVARSLELLRNFKARLG